MWILRCRTITQRILHKFESASMTNTKYPSRTLRLSTNTNKSSCQETVITVNSDLCKQARMGISNNCNEASLDFHSKVSRRLLSTFDKDDANPPKKEIKPFGGPSSTSRAAKEDCEKYREGGKKGDIESIQRQERTPCNDDKLKSKNHNMEGSSNTRDGDLAGAERQALQNFHEPCVEKINAQINNELKSAYMYVSMASFCNQDNVALSGFAKFFTHSYKEEMEHMDKLIEYLNKRGGQLRLMSVGAPPKHEWTDVEDLVTNALQMEKELNESLLKLHECASQHGDANLTDFLESHFLQEQVDAIKSLADLLTVIRRAGKGLGVHMVDRDLKNGLFNVHGNAK